MRILFKNDFSNQIILLLFFYIVFIHSTKNMNSNENYYVILSYMSEYLKTTFSLLEIITFFVFLVYLIFPVKMPYFLAEKVNSVLGMTFILFTVIFLLIFTHPVVGLLSIIVAIILVHRSSKTDKINMIFRHNKSENEKDKEMKIFNPPQHMTFEEEFIEKNAPVSDDITSSVFLNSSFKPINENVYGASSF